MRKSKSKSLSENRYESADALRRAVEVLRRFRRRYGLTWSAVEVGLVMAAEMTIDRAIWLLELGRDK